MNTPNIMWTRCLMNMNLSSDWHLNTLKSLFWCFQHECQAVQYVISKFLEGWISSLCCFPQRQCPTDSSLLHNEQNLKQIKHICKINNSKWWQFTYHTLNELTGVYVGDVLHRKWSRQPKFESWMSLFAFRFVLMPLEKA